MREDVSATKRKPLSAKQRLKMFEAHKGLCCLCGLKITTTKWIDEHIRPLAQGGSNDLANRGPAHVKCAEAKTNGKTGDNAASARAKRKKTAAVVGKDRKGPPIQSAGFQPAQKQAKATKPIEKKTPVAQPSRHPELPRRGLFK